MSEPAATVARRIIEHREREEWERLAHVWSTFGAPLALRNLDAATIAYGGLSDAVRRAHPILHLASEVVRAVASDDDSANRRILRAMMIVSEHWNPNRLPDYSPDEVAALGTATILRLRADGDIEGARALADRVEQDLSGRASSCSSHPTPRNRGWFHLQAGLSSLILLDLSDARRHSSLASEYTDASVEDYIGVNASAQLALIAAIAGDPADVERHLARDREIGGLANRLDRLARLPSHIARMMRAVELLDFATADRLAPLVIAGASGAELWAFTLSPLVLNLAIRGRHQEALATLDRIVDSSPPVSTVTDTFVARMRAQLMLAIDLPEPAFSLLHRTPDPTMVLATLRARAHLITGGLAAARSTADAALTQPSTPHDRVDLLLTRASASLEEGLDESAATDVAQALRIARDSRTLLPFALLDPASRSRLLALAHTDPQVVAAGDEWELRELLGRRDVVGMFPPTLRRVTLTQRERAVLLGAATYETMQEIAESEFVSVHTVKKQLTSAYRKLGVGSRADAIARARALGLL